MVHFWLTNKLPPCAYRRRASLAKNPLGRGAVGTLTRYGRLQLSDCGNSTRYGTPANAGFEGRAFGPKVPM